ncbi:MAG: hypothetical protein ACNA7W_00680 [Pseudomonadales bacterium]
MQALVRPADTFPNMRIRLTNAQHLATPEGFADDYTILLFFRGHW